MTQCSAIFELPIYNGLTFQTEGIVYVSVQGTGGLLVVTYDK